MTPLGALVRRGRKDANLTLREAAAKLGVDFTYISKIETMKERYAPSDDLILRMATLYKLDADALFVAAGKCPPDLQRELASNIATVKTLRAMLAGEQGRVPAGAPWFVTDDTGNCWEIKFDDSWVGRIIYKRDYEDICHVWESADEQQRLEIVTTLRAWR